jgi:hypothetical protein
MGTKQHEGRDAYYSTACEVRGEPARENPAPAEKPLLEGWKV